MLAWKKKFQMLEVSVEFNVMLYNFAHYMCIENLFYAHTHSHTLKALHNLFKYSSLKGYTMCRSSTFSCLDLGELFAARLERRCQADELAYKGGIWLKLPASLRHTALTRSKTWKVVMVVVLLLPLDILALLTCPTPASGYIGQVSEVKGG